MNKINNYLKNNKFLFFI